MALVTKENAKVGTKVFTCCNDFDNFGYTEGIITEVYDDHYCYLELDLGIVIYGTYYTTENSAVFTTKEEAKEWLGLGVD